MSVQAIDRIQPLWTDLQTEGMRLDAGAEVGGTRRTQPTLFSDIFQSAIDRVRETDAAKNEVAYQLATGQLDNPAALLQTTHFWLLKACVLLFCFSLYLQGKRAAEP